MAGNRLTWLIHAGLLESSKRLGQTDKTRKKQPVPSNSPLTGKIITFISYRVVGQLEFRVQALACSFGRANLRRKLKLVLLNLN
jgi:hypothetical protein